MDEKELLKKKKFNFVNKEFINFEHFDFLSLNIFVVDDPVPFK